MDPMSGFDIRLVFPLPPRDSTTVHCSTKDVYTFEITFLALHPWDKVDLNEIDPKKKLIHGTEFNEFERCCRTSFPQFNYN